MTLALTDHPNEYCNPVHPASEADWPRPLWSVLIPTHNCAKYLEQALQSVLKQDPGSDRMEILVIDDHSTLDDPEEVVRRIAGDRVRFIRQPENVGKCRNYQTGLNASRGHLIHQLHGDDTVSAGFYESMESCFASYPEAGAFFCESEYINEHNAVTGKTGREQENTGFLDNWLQRIYIQQRIQTPSIVLRREVYEKIGGFDQRLTACEDWEMWVRASVCFPFGFNAQCIAQYRVYPHNTSHASILSGCRLSIQKETLQIIDSYVPTIVKVSNRAERSLAMAYSLVRSLPITIKHCRPIAWVRTLGHIASYSLHPRVWYYALRFTLQYRKYTS